MGAGACAGADLWGGSLGATSDYVVRGISRSDERPAVQADVHYLSSSGFIAGAFASNAQADSGESKDVELDAFLGFAWRSGDDWRGKAILSHYAYPGSSAGTAYDYDEIAIETAYADWLDVTVAYSPDAPRYVRGYGLAGVASESVELGFQRPVMKRLTASVGAGYSHYGGTGGAGYGYFSVGATYDLAPVSLSLSYVNTTSEAKALFYNEAERGRLIATAIFRF